MAALEDDVPFGVLGRLFGLRVLPPKFYDGEEIRWSARANRFQSRLRSVGGRLYLTDQRLVFARNKAESMLGGKEWNVDLADLESAEEASMRSIRVKSRIGRDERFVVASKSQTADLVDEAIKTAGRREPG